MSNIPASECPGGIQSCKGKSEHVTSTIDPFEPPIRDRTTSAYVVEMREQRDVLFQEVCEENQSRIIRHTELYAKTLDGLSQLLGTPLETSDLDLQARTIWSARWLLAGRSLSLSSALIYLVREGFCSEAFPTGRSIHEVNQMLRVFCYPQGGELVKRWLDGKTPKPKTVQKIARQIEVDENRTRAAEGLPPIPRGEDEGRKLYDALSDGGHVSRSSLDSSISYSMRTLGIGPTVDFGMRAYYVSWVGGVVWETTYVVSLALATVFGTRFHGEHLQPLLDRLSDIEAHDAFPDGSTWRSPVEFEEEVDPT